MLGKCISSLIFSIMYTFCISAASKSAIEEPFIATPCILDDQSTMFCSGFSTYQKFYGTKRVEGRWQEIKGSQFAHNTLYLDENARFIVKKDQALILSDITLRDFTFKVFKVEAGAQIVLDNVRLIFPGSWLACCCGCRTEEIVHNELHLACHGTITFEGGPYRFYARPELFDRSEGGTFEMHRGIDMVDSSDGIY